MHRYRIADTPRGSVLSRIAGLAARSLNVPMALVSIVGGGNDILRPRVDLDAIADDLGVTRAQLALAWLLRQKGVSSVITGATRSEQIRDTVKAFAFY